MAEPKQLPNGRWKIRFRDPLGRPRSKVCDTKREARAFAEDIAHAGRQGSWILPERGKITLEAWSAQYMATVVHLRPTSIALYQRELVHIHRRFGSIPLGQFNALDIQTWLADLLVSGVAPSSVHRKYRMLRRLLQVAVEKEMIVKNPCIGVQPPRVESNEMRFLSPQEAVALAETIDPWFKALVYTAIETGMRWSELVGLRRRQVNLLKRTVTVIEQLVFVGGDASVGRIGRWVNQKPKTKAGTRTISISPFLAAQLAEQIENRSQPGLDGLVFVNMRGGPIGGSIFNKRHWQPVRSALGFDDLRFHDLRHTAVALAIAQGAHPKAIQRRMGHSTINMTLDRYGHLFPELDEKVANDIGSVLKVAANNRRGGSVVRALDRGVPSVPD
jgi:integrase